MMNRHDDQVVESSHHFFLIEKRDGRKVFIFLSMELRVLYSMNNRAISSKAYYPSHCQNLRRLAEQFHGLGGLGVDSWAGGGLTNGLALMLLDMTILKKKTRQFPFSMTTLLFNHVASITRSFVARFMICSYRLSAQTS